MSTNTKIFWLVAVLGLGSVLAWWGFSAQRPDVAAEGTGTSAPVASPAAERGAGRPESARSIAVEVAEARMARTSRDVRAIGSLQSDEAVQLGSEIAGRVSAIEFEEGRPVKAGDILVRLDDALVQAEVSDAQARLTLAEANNDRARQLSRTGNVTERSRDEALSNFETARAALELAKTRLSKHVLRAPFDGIAGVRNVSLGAFVAVGTPIVNIEKIDGLKVDFKVPETYLQAVSVGQRIDVHVDAVQDRTFEGSIYAINPLIDVNGRALQVRARIENRDQVLRPGLFARILIKGVTERDVVVIPESAVMPRSGDAFVFKVDGGKAVETRIRLGQRSNAEVEVLNGLASGDTVVIAGQHKLRNGTAVEVVAGEPGTAAGRAAAAVPARSGG